MEIYIRPDRGFAAAPDQRRADHGRRRLALRRGRGLQGRRRGRTSSRPSSWRPTFAARVRAATREAPFLGGAVPGFFRKPFGAGLGAGRRCRLQQGPDHRAGHQRRLPRRRALLDGHRRVAQRRPTVRRRDDAWHQDRDAGAMPIYEFTSQLATLEPPPPEMQQLLGAVHGNQEAMDGFVSVVAGTVSPAEFFSQENIGRIAQAARRPAEVALGRRARVVNRVCEGKGSHGCLDVLPRLIDERRRSVSSRRSAPAGARGRQRPRRQPLRTQSHRPEPGLTLTGRWCSCVPRRARVVSSAIRANRRQSCSPL